LNYEGEKYLLSEIIFSICSDLPCCQEKWQKNENI